MNTTAFFIFTGGFLVVLIVSIILMATSYGVVDFNNMALKKSTYSKNIEQGYVYKQGRYFNGVTGTFIQYSQNYQYITLDEDDGDSGQIVGKTSDASPQQLSVSAVVVFKFKSEFLYKLYNDYPNQNQKNDMISAIKDIIYKVIAEYKSDDFFTNRYVIQNSMGQQIDSYFRDNFHSEVVMFLLKEIGLSNEIETQQISNLVTQQNSKTQEIQNEITEKEAQINVIENNALSLVDTSNSQFAADASEVYQNYISQGEINYYTNYTLAYQDLSTDVPWISASFQVWFTNYMNLINNQNITLLYLKTNSEAVVSV